MYESGRPTIGKDSTIYYMVHARNYRLLFSTMIVLVCGMYLAYGAISSPGTQNLYSLTLDLLVLEIAGIGLYLFYKRSRDIYHHPDMERFLWFNDPGRAVDLFEREVGGGDAKWYRNGCVTRNFIVSESLFHFPWTFYSEVAGAHLRPTIWAMAHVPFFNPYRVVITLADGNRMQLSCGCRKEAENLMKTIASSAPAADKSSDRSVMDAVRRRLNATVSAAAGSRRPAEFPEDDLEQLSALISAGPTVAQDGQERPGKAVKGPSRPSPGPDRVKPPARPASPREVKKAASPKDQISRLYRALEAGDLDVSVEIIDAMGDTTNVDAADILIILLEDPAELIRAHAALALGKLGQKAAVGPLIELLEDRSPPVRENAAIALGMIGDNRAEIPLQKVGIDNPRVKRAAVHALTRIEGKKARTF